MSADLLAGFDPYYVPPNSNNADTSTPAPATGTFDELSFFDAPQPQPSAPPQNGSAVTNNSMELGNMRSSSPPPENDYDAWGDFVAPEESPPRPFTNSSQKPYGDLDECFPPRNRNSAQQDAPVRPAARIRAPTEDFFSPKRISRVIEKGDPSQIIGQQKPAEPTTVVKRKAKSPHKHDPNVLFDADDPSEDEPEEDDFGEFENAPAPPTAQDMDIFSNDVDAVAATLEKLSMPVLPRQKAPEERNPFADCGSSHTPNTNSSNSSRVVTPWPVYGEQKSEVRAQKTAPRRPPPTQMNWDDPISKPVATTVDAADAAADPWAWGEDSSTPNVLPKPQSKPASKSAPKPVCTPVPTPIAEAPVTEKQDDSWGWDALDDDSAPSKPVIQNDSPPTNVPPPTVLLAFFPDVLTSVQSILFSPGLKQKIQSNPSLLTILKSYLFTSIVSAHVLSGRKLRWKRDKILSQSMSIGQAGARGKSGMKLMGVDKAEAAREDREAEIFVRWWKDQVGRLRSAVAVANLTIMDHGEHLSVPEIGEVMPVRTATLDEGALTAPKCCFLCGLKREERVARIDAKVEDSFSEWWVDHWGHSACRDFWIAQSDNLKHR